MKKNDRVRLNERGVKHHPQRTPNRVGVILSAPFNSGVRVQWEGNKCSSRENVAFLELSPCDHPKCRCKGGTALCPHGAH